MRNYVLLALCLIVAGINNLSAQFNSNYSSSIGVTGGYAEDGVGLLLTYNYHILTNRRKVNYAQVGILGTIAEDKEGRYDIPYNIFTVNPGYFFNIYEQPRWSKIFVYIGGGGVIGYEVFNNGNNELDNGAVIDGKSQFIYGAFVGAEFEYMISDSWRFIIKANEYYHANSDVGNYYFFGGIGIRYLLF